LALFFFTVAVIIYTVIGNSIFYHKNEIEVISLVWGKPSFIYGPFLFQGAFYAFFSMILVTLLILFLRSIVRIEILSWPLMSLGTTVQNLLPHTLLYESGIFIFLGILSSTIALSRFSKN
jgi:cell division transport system permease protein